MFRDILLDLDETLLDFSAGERAAFSETLKIAGIKQLPEMYERYSAINDSFWKRFERGEIERAEIQRGRFRVWVEEFGIPGDTDWFNSTYLDQLSAQAIPTDGAMELLNYLCVRYDLHLISNGLDRVQIPRLARAGMTDFFKNRFISSELGVQKPEKAYFDVIAATIDGFDPARALVIGDSLSSDIRGANNAGLPCCWFNPHGKPKPDDLRIDYEITSLYELKSIL